MNDIEYSTLFSCLHDEKFPVGHLGRGTHYSVFRSVEWLDVIRSPLLIPQIHDFSVIWDEDHDTRIIEVIESIYMSGLFSPVQFIGERKGVLTVIVAAKFYFYKTDKDIEYYKKQIQEICNKANNGDTWSVELGMFDRSPGSPHQTHLHGLISDEQHRVVTYVRNIDSLWRLGTKEFNRKNHFYDSPLPPLPEIPPIPKNSHS